MNANDFRRIALSMPRAIEAAHMGHPDFRVGKRIFATLGYPDKGWAVVKLTPQQQWVLVAGKSAAFSPVPGGWGRGGSTRVQLSAADRTAVREALALAWKNVAPKALLQLFEGDTQEKRDAGLARVRACAARAHLPSLEAGTSYGTPSLKVAGKFLLRIRDASTLVLRCDLEEKQMLTEMAPNIYFETDHYKGWPAVLIRLPRIDDDELRHRLIRAWLFVAPKRLAAAYQQQAAAAEKGR